MAVRLSRATGNWLTAGTWGLVDATSYNNSESTATALSTSYQASSGSTTGAITVDGVAVKLSVRTGTTGTISVRIATGGTLVAGTEVTINVSDLPIAATADLNGGWQFFKFSSPVTLLAATAYTVDAKTSNASQVSLRSTSGSNWARALVTTTTGAPAAGDDLIICGEYLSAGSSNSFTVTMDETASTDYGAASTSLVTPAIAICNKGTLSYGTSAATNYNLKVSGHIIVYSGGNFSIGTTGTPIPRGSTATLLFDCGSNVDFGLTVRNLGIFNAQGLSRTSGKDIYYCKLNTNEAANSTSLGVDTDTGWLDNDEIAIASTSRTAADSEKGTLNGDANTSDLTVDGFAGAGGGLAVAHLGTSPTQAEIILLTRSIVIRGVSATVQSFVNFNATSTVDVDWTEFKWLGSNTTGTRGIDCGVTTGSVSIQYSSMHNFESNSSRGFNMTGTTGTGLIFSNNVQWNVYSEGFINVANSGSSVIDGNIFIKNAFGANQAMINIGDVGSTFTNNTIVGCFNVGLTFTEFNGVITGTISGNTVHSNRGSGVNLGGQILGGTISNTNIWRNNGYGLTLNVFASDVIFDTITLFGNNNASITQGGAMLDNITFNNMTSNGDTTFSTTMGIESTSAPNTAVFNFNSCNFSTASGILTAHTTDITVSNPQLYQIKMQNTILAASSEIGSQTTLTTSSFISSEKHDGVSGANKTWKKYGTLSSDTGTVHSGTMSLKMTPNNASNKLTSQGAIGGFQAAVSSGSAVTLSCYVFEDGSYVGDRARLMIKRNDSIGITSDTVVATATSASDSAWELLSGTSPTPSEDGVMEFYVDCAGTAGSVYVDSVTVS